jgi:hypothetical protein
MCVLNAVQAKEKTKRSVFIPRVPYPYPFGLHVYLDFFLFLENELVRHAIVIFVLRHLLLLLAGIVRLEV